MRPAPHVVAAGFVLAAIGPAIAQEHDAVPTVPMEAPPEEIPDDSVDLAEAFAQLARAGNLKLVVDPSIRERVSLRGFEMPARDAVDLVARMFHCEVEVLPGEVLYVSQPPRVTIQFVEADVREVLRLIAAYSGENVLLTAAVRGRVTVDLEGVHWLAALSSVARGAGFVVVEQPDGLLVVREGPQPAPGPRPALGADGKRVDVDVVDAPIEDVVATLSSAVGRDVLVAPEVHERVTVSLRDVPYRGALEVLARITRCRLTEQGGVLVLDRPPAVTYQAAGAPAAVWFSLLAKRAELGLAAGQLVGSVDCDLRRLAPADVLRYTAEASGFEAAFEGSAVRVARAPGADAGGGPGAGDDRLSALLRDVESLARRGDAAALEPRLAELLREVRGARPAPPAPAQAKEERVPAEVVARLDALFKRIVALGQRKQVEDLVVACAELKDLVDAGGLPAVRVARERLGRVADELADLGEVAVSITLQLDIVEGNAHLRAMADAIETGDHAAVPPHMRALEALVEGMRGQEYPVFHRNAEALFVRGTALFERARRLARLDLIPLALTAIVHDLGPERTSQAIVNGWVVAEDDVARDAAGAELPVRVIEITRGAVRFRSDDLDFVRELGK